MKVSTEAYILRICLSAKAQRAQAEGAETNFDVEICKSNSNKHYFFGEVAEWFKAHAWKACIRSSVSWVRIPSSPPFTQKAP